MKTQKPRPLFIFYLLVVYIFLQFIGWSYLMLKQNKEIHHQRLELMSLKSKDSQEYRLEEQSLNNNQQKRWLMLIGEGSVFFFLLALGALKIHRTFKAEVSLAKQQKNFLLSVTHELKSPIASIKLQLQTLLKRDLEKGTQKEIISNALNDNERLNSLVENMLFAAKIENEGFKLHKELTNISILISDIISQLQMLLKERKIISIIESDVFMEVDVISFPSIILNLIENALKYSAHGSEITIDLMKSENQVILRVKDQGIGIAEHEKELIFKKFYRTENEETRKTKGTGLGLYITKFLAEEHNGAISIKNNLPNGSIFEIAFNMTPMKEAT